MGPTAGVASRLGPDPELSSMTAPELCFASRPGAPDEASGKVPDRASAAGPLGSMRLGLLSLRFVGPSAGLEAGFRQAYLVESIPRMRVALLLGAAFFGSFGILDAYLMPDQAYVVWAIRYGGICPLLLAGAALTRVPALHRSVEPGVAALMVLGGAGIVAMIVVAPPPVNYFYYAGLILVFMYGYVYLRLRFVWASAGGWLIVVLYELVAWSTDMPATVLISNNAFFISANIIGMLACYTLEASFRRSYFLRRRLEEEEQRVRQANQQLERRVVERTAELETNNRVLQQEIAERRKAEADRTRLEVELRQAQKMEAIGSLAAGVAHDLNNTLTSLVGYPDLLLEDLPADSPVREPIRAIQEAGHRAAATVQDLLTLARRGVVDRRVVSVNDLLREYFRSPEFARLRREHPHVAIETNLAPDLLNVLGPPVQLLKALMNLVMNAAEATLVDGTVTVATSNRYLDQPVHGFETVPEGEYVVVRVDDTGVGIAGDDLQRIFEPFFSKKQLKRSGTGLGMTVVWTAVKDVGGLVDVTSVEGRGTTFDLYLPVSRQDPEQEPARITIDDCRGSERLLVVDDVSEQRDIATRMLSKLGYRVATAASGELALAWLADRPADLLVLDMTMEPGIDGCETFRRAVAVRPGLKAIIASGYAENARVREAQRLGAGSYLRKPYTMEKLAMAVRRELDRPR
jgi:signal transduction histidine kinase